MFSTSLIYFKNNSFTILYVLTSASFSDTALLSENGPCSASSDGQSTVSNPYSWNSNANIMWVDQPAGVGHSYGVKKDKDEAGVANDMYDFLQAFFKAHPEYVDNAFFVFGKSRLQYS